MNYTDDLVFLLKQGWQTMTDPVYGGQIIYKDFDPATFNLNTLFRITILVPVEEMIKVITMQVLATITVRENAIGNWV